MAGMPTPAPGDPAADPGGTRTRDQIPDADKWNLADIYEDWDAWEAALGTFEAKIDGYASLQGTLARAGRRPAGRVPASATSSASWRTGSGTTPRCATTRTSATTP